MGASLDLPDHVRGVVFRVRVTQRVHDLVEQAFACLDIDLAFALAERGVETEFGELALDVLLLPS